MRFPTQELQLKAERKGTAYLVVTTVFKCGGQGGTSSIACFTFYSSDGFLVFQVEMFPPESDCRSLIPILDWKTCFSSRFSVQSHPELLKNLLLNLTSHVQVKKIFFVHLLKRLLLQRNSIKLS